MLSPDYIDALPEKIIVYWQDVEDYIIKDIARRIVKADGITGTVEIQRLVLENLGADLSDIDKRIATAINKTQDAVTEMFNDAAEKVQGDYDTLSEKSGIPIDKGVINQITKAAIATSRGNLSNITRTMGFVTRNGQMSLWNQAFREQLSFATMQVASGGVSYTQAARETIKMFAGNGMMIQYPSGARRSLEAAVRLNITSGISQMANSIAQENAAQLGADGWEISAHAACAPDHEPYQGRQYTAEEYEALNNMLERPIGTLNCKHTAYPIILGLSEPAYTQEQLDEMRRANAEGITYEGQHYTMYEATQMQRKIERSIRQMKRELIGADAAHDKELFMNDSIRLRRLRDYYADFSAKAGLPTQNERAQVAGYGKSISAKSVFAYNQAVSQFKAAHKVSQDTYKISYEVETGTGDKTVYSETAISYDSRYDADKVFRPETEALWKDLNALEKESAYEYTEGSGPFNRPLRGYDKSWNNYVGPGKVPLNNEGKEANINALTDAINKSKGLKQDTWLYRGSDKQSLAGLLGIDQSKVIPSNADALNRKFASGGSLNAAKVTDNGFFSTGVAQDAGFKDTVSYEILAPKGTKGIYAEPFSKYGGTNTTGTWDGVQTSSNVGAEAEMILQRGAVFKVLKIENRNGKLNVVMEVVP